MRYDKTGKQNWFDDEPKGGNRFDPETGQELPKFDSQTGKQNWW